MPKVLIPIPSRDFDPTEVAVPWKILITNQIEVVFATPNGQMAVADLRMLTGQGLGIWSALLKADSNGRKAYQEMKNSHAFQTPTSWSDVKAIEFDAVILPGGHAPGMKPYLESEILQSLVADFFASQKLVGAICHGVVLAARSLRPDGKGNLFGFQTTALLQTQELTAWRLTRLWLNDYYRTYPETVQSEVTRSLAKVEDFLPGPLPLRRDSPESLERGFVVEDRNYISARWPGDAHLFATTMARRLKS